MATMNGIVLPGNRRLEFHEAPVPEPGHGQVLVRMKASSLCGSDLRAIFRPTRAPARRPTAGSLPATSRPGSSSAWIPE